MWGARDGGGLESMRRAVSQWYTGVPQVRRVRSVPGVSISARERGRVKSSTGTCSTDEEEHQFVIYIEMR